MLTHTERAYLAGLFDGEACITMFTMQNAGGRPATVARVHLGMCEPNIIRWLEQKTGNGSVSYRRRGKPNWKDLATITWQGKNASALLQMVLPYLKVKRRQAEIAIEWVAAQAEARHHIGGRGRKTYPEAVLDIRDRLLSEMRRLNQRGASPASR